MKKRILIFHPALAPYRVDFFNSLGEAFDCTIVFLTRNNENQNFDQSKLLANATYKYEYLDKHYKFAKRNVNMGYWAKIKKHNPDIVITCEYGLSLWTAYSHKLFTRGKYKLYTMCDDSMDICRNCKGIRKHIRNFFASHINGIITINPDVSNWYRTNTRIKKIVDFPIIRKEAPYIKTLEEIRNISNEYIHKFSLENKKILGFVGRLTLVKNLAELLEVFSYIPQEKKKDVILLFIGNGELEQSLKEKGKSLVLNDNIIFAGRYEGDELLAWYPIIDTLLLPSYFEPFGAVTGEALLAGCRGMISKYCGSSCLINENNGIVFDSLDDADFQKALEYIIDSARPTTKAGERPNNMPMSYNNKINALITFLND